MKYATLIFCLFIIGCMAPYKKVRVAEEPISNQEILSRYLDRSGGWERFSSQIKVRLQVGDTTLNAKGFLTYSSPEQYSLSFARPYNQVIGDIYLTATQTMYWGNNQTKLFITETDTVHIPELIPFSFPDWDPRELMPFAVSGRTAGFQVISEATDSLNRPWIHGECGKAVHDLQVDPTRGVINEEMVVRCGTDPVYKSYSRYYSINGWPVPTRVVCQDRTGRVSLTWTIYNIQLSSPDYFYGEPESSSLIPQYHE